MFLPFFDPMYFVFALPALLAMLYAQMKVRSAYGKYSREQNMGTVTGAQAARRMLDSTGLDDVAIEMVSGDLTDHYDPRGRILRLSENVYSNPSVAAMGIAAHEIGHAVQDRMGYGPLRLRAGLVPVANLGSWLGYILFILGIIVQFSGLTWIGIILFSTAVVFALLTLPVEFDASSRALKMLQTNGLVSNIELKGARSVLNAAALTYVAALLQAVGQLLYLVLLASGTDRRDE